jgi:hypothetical protein
MREFLSKIIAAVDRHVDIRGDWPALVFAACVFAAGLSLALTMPIGR